MAQKNTSKASKRVGKLVVQYRKAAELVPYERNARTHSEEQVLTIARSISAFGWTNPILVDERNGIVAGHGRLKAAKLLGMDEIPVLELTGLSEAQKRAYVLADNQLAINGGWDDDILRQEIEALQGTDIDLGLLGNIDLKAAIASDAGDKGFRSPVIKYLLLFDNTEQQEVWFSFVKRLKMDFPDADTLSQRLNRFLEREAA